VADLRMPNSLRNDTVVEPAADAGAVARAENVVSAIKLLIAGLPPPEQERVLIELNRQFRPIPTERAGDVLATIVRLLPSRRQWKVEDLRQGVDAQNVEATPKEVYNALSYLARKGRIRRVGYGRYVLDGAELTTVDDLGLPPTRHEDEYRTDKGD
jgi:hypothetical protein